MITVNLFHISVGLFDVYQFEKMLRDNNYIKESDKNHFAYFI